MPVYAIKTIAVNTASGTATSVTSDWIPMDIHSTPFNVGFGCVVGGNGDITYRVEHTFDNVFDPDVTPTAFVHEDVSGTSSDQDGNYAYGVRAIRAAIVSASSSGNVTLTVIQAGL